VRGQLSAEMLILLALILGLVFIVYSQMTKSVEDVSGTVDESTERLSNAARINPSDYRCGESDKACQKIDEDWTCGDDGYCEER
jgi:hypothetical protein